VYQWRQALLSGVLRTAPARICCGGCSSVGALQHHVLQYDPPIVPSKIPTAGSPMQYIDQRRYDHFIGRGARPVDPDLSRALVELV